MKLQPVNPNSTHNPNDAQVYVTNQLAIAAFLTATGSLKLLRTDWDDSRSMGFFVFLDPLDRGPELESEFLTADASAPAQKFHHQLRVLRQMIESVKRNRDVQPYARRNNNGRNNDDKFSRSTDLKRGTYGTTANSVHNR